MGEEEKGRKEVFREKEKLNDVFGDCFETALSLTLFVRGSLLLPLLLFVVIFKSHVKFRGSLG